jgi:hypothetical protein
MQRLKVSSVHIYYTYVSSRGTMLHSCIKVRQCLIFTEADRPNFSLEIGYPIRIFVISFCLSITISNLWICEDMTICNCDDNGDIAQDGNFNNDITKVMMQHMISAISCHECNSRTRLQRRYLIMASRLCHADRNIALLLHPNDFPPRQGPPGLSAISYCVKISTLQWHFISSR